MECKKNFTLRFKEIKDIISEFESVVNEINDLNGSNSLNNSTGIADQLSNEYISYSGDENRSGCCWSNEHQKPINTTQSTSTNGIFATECGVTPDTKINDQNITPNCWSKRCQESINRIQSTDTNPVNILATACGRNDCDYLNVSHKLDKTNLSKSNPIDDNICNDNNYPNGSVMNVELLPVDGFDEKLLENVLQEASSKRVVNYLYYLCDNYDTHDTFEQTMDIDITDSTTLSTRDFDMPDQDEFISNVDVEQSLSIEVARQSIVVQGVTTGPISTPPNVNFIMNHQECDDREALNYEPVNIDITDSTTLLTRVLNMPEWEEFISNVDVEQSLSTEEASQSIVMQGVTTGPISTPPNANFIISHQECDDRDALNYKPVLEGNREDDFMECETFETEGNRGCDNSKMYIPTSDAGPKKYFCKYCKVRVQKFARHLENIHYDEKDVQKFLEFAPNTIPRRKIISRILKQGEFLWNSDYKLNEGQYSVRRRPNKKFQKKPWDVVTCPRCLGTYNKSYLSRHWSKECAKNPLRGERGLHQLGRAVESRIHPDASEDLVGLFARLRDNDNIRQIRFDWLVTVYGNELCLNHSPHYQQGYICNKLRAAGRVLRESKAISSKLTDMASLFHVKNCNTLVDAIRTMGKFDYKTKRFASPGTASSAVTLINAIGRRLITESMKSDELEKERNARRFLEVFESDVKNKINKLAAVTRLENKRNKKEIIPTTDDVRKFARYIDTERETCYSQLVEKFTYKIWLKLSQLTMVSILVYNRRRAGEMQNLLMQDFKQRDIVTDQCEEFLNAIPDAAKRRIKSRLTVRNKLGKKLVPVLLKHHWDDCLTLLIHYRKDARIPEKNNYLFPLPTELERIRTANVWTIMRSFALASGAADPYSLTGTNLRKHMATFSSTKDLSDTDISNLADFMGHAEAVHRAYYRTNPLTNQVGKMSFLLECALGNATYCESGDDITDSEGDSDAYESDSGSTDGVRSKTTRRVGKKINSRQLQAKNRKKSIPKKSAKNMKVMPEQVAPAREEKVKKERNATRSSKKTRQTK